MYALLRRFAQSEDGATAIEYGMIVACIALALVAAFTAVGGSIQDLFGGVRDKVVNVSDNALV
jgi:pilus assembly protein Flp/PilA